MSAKKKGLRLFLISAMAFSLVFCGIQFIQAQQIKTMDKPPKDPKPPKDEIVCNNDLICTSDEYDSSKSFEEQPCPDCAPKNHDPLDTSSSFLMGMDGNIDYLFQFRYDPDSQKYMETWACETPRSLYDFGDYDADGITDILAFQNLSFTEGKGKKKTTYFEQKILVFEQGSDGAPAFEKVIYGPSTDKLNKFSLADANGDGYENELLCTTPENNALMIYRWNGSAFTNIWTSPVYADSFWTYVVGDADGDGENEIVCSMFRGGYALVIEYLGNNQWGDERATEVITAVDPDIGWIAIDQVVPCDADNDGFSDDIIAGGNNGRLMVWSLVDGIYRTVFISDPLDGMTQGVACGDFNGDGENEIAVGTHTGNLYIFKLECINPNPSAPEYNLQLFQSIPTDNSFIYLVTGDADGDGRDEILHSQVIYGDDGSGVEQVFQSYFLVFSRVK